MGIEPTKPLLAQSFIGFEDRAAHQSRMRFRGRAYTVGATMAVRAVSGGRGCAGRWRGPG
jgi:hypothetical protein